MNQFKMRFLALLIVSEFLSLTGILYSQTEYDNWILNSPKEYDNWNFGIIAGVSFISGHPILIHTTLGSSYEGSASISDKDGNPLLGTDGYTIYRRINPSDQTSPDKLFNGTRLSGDNSSTQVQIVPQPGNNKIYYVFTVDCAINHLAKGLRYSIVDMNMELGNGAVISKNNLLLAPATEKIAIGRHSNGTDFWIVAHGWGNNSFYSYLLDSSGLGTTPVISSVGATHFGGVSEYSDSTDNGYTNAKGYMKFSPGFEKIALAIHDAGVIELLRFDRSTGSVTQLLASDTVNRFLYGIEFSPDERLLYASTIYSNSVLYQFKITNNSLSEPVIIASGNDQINALQLAKDGKIYSSPNGKSYLNAIGNPNNQGTSCNYVENAISLYPGTAKRGLPLYLGPFYPGPSKNDFIVKNFCYSDFQYFSIISQDIPDSVTWNFGDPGSGVKNISHDTLGVHHYPRPSTYTVELTVYSGGTPVKISRQITFSTPPIVDLGPDQIICGGAVLLDVSPYTGSCLWDDGTTSPMRTVFGGPRWVRVSNSCGSSHDTILINFYQAPVLNIPSDTTICRGEKLLLKAPDDPDLSYTWFNGDHSNEITISPESTTSVYLNAQNERGCGRDYYTTVKVVDCDNTIINKILIPNVFTPNQDNTNDNWIIKNVENYPRAEVYVYTRWGKLVFVSQGYEFPWDGTYGGKLLPIDTYYYVIILNNGTPAYKGRVTIYR